MTCRGLQLLPLALGLWLGAFACQDGGDSQPAAKGKAKESDDEKPSSKKKAKTDDSLGEAEPGGDDEGGDDSGEKEGGGKELKAEKKAVTFPGSRGDQVPGYVWYPKRQAGEKFPGVLILYGIKGNKDDGSIGRAGEELAKRGMLAMTLDWPGTGSRGNISSQDRIMNTDVLQWTVGDYGAALNYMTSLPEVDGGRIGYVGASMGAMTGIAFAAQDSRVKSLVAIVPIPNPLWGSADPSSAIRSLGRPVLCISTNDNSDFSSSVCQNVGQGGEAKTMPGGHELSGFRDQVVTITTEFLERTLKP